MSIRDSKIYLSGEVSDALWILSKSTGDVLQNPPDKLADLWLRDLLTEKYPQVLKYLADRETSQEELIESLRKKP